MSTSGPKNVLGIAALLVATVTPAWTERPEFPLTKRELEVRTGYYTESGKYRGGIPQWDNELEYYECQRYNIDENGNGTSIATNGDPLNATVCMEWVANEASSGEFEKGSCSCKSIAGGDYCDAWTCSQLEVDTQETCNGDSDNCFFETETEHTRCGCEVEDDSGHFCAFWKCLDTDSDGNQEHEEYTCSRSSPSGLYCEAWTGDIEGEEEVEMSTCECVEEWNGDQVCSYWECEERGMNKCTAAGGSWCNLGVSVGVGGGLGFLGVLGLCDSVLRCGGEDADDKGAAFRCAIFSFLWMAAWSSGVVIWGGQDGAMWVGIWWGVPIVAVAISCACNCCCKGGGCNVRETVRSVPQVSETVLSVSEMVETVAEGSSSSSST